MHVPFAFFHAVQLSGLYEDCKAFVDRPARYNNDEMASLWASFHRDWDGSAPPLRHFIENVTSPEGSDLTLFVPVDWREKTEAWLREAGLDDDLRQWALYLHRMWKDLCRVTRISPTKASQHSLLPLPRPFFVPGDRFREIYYWDSHWIVLGLIVSEMYDSAIDHIECLLALLERYGFVPNGGRHYYTNRSQPPLLSMTLRALYDETLHHVPGQRSAHLSHSFCVRCLSGGGRNEEEDRGRHPTGDTVAHTRAPFLDHPSTWRLCKGPLLREDARPVTILCSNGRSTC